MQIKHTQRPQKAYSTNCQFNFDKSFRSRDFLNECSDPVSQTY